MSDLTPELVAQALEGELEAQGRLVAELSSPIQWSVAKMLRRWRTGAAAGRHLRQEVEDMVQEVFLELFEDHGKTLRRWDPERLPLGAFVGYVARIRTAEVLRSRRSPWREEPSPVEDLPRGSSGHTPEDQALSQAGSAPAAPPNLSLEVLYAGCAAVSRGPVCVPYGELTLWVRSTPEAEIEVRLGGTPAEAAGVAVDGGRRLALAVEPADREIEILAAAGGREASFRLFLADSAKPPCQRPGQPGRPQQRTDRRYRR